MVKKAYGLLEGKKGIVFGPLDESSLGWKIAEAASREGARFAISNVKVAFRLGKVTELAKMCHDAPLIVCDASSNEDLDRAFAEAKGKLGSLDFMIHSIGMSPNVRKKRDYTDLNYDWYHKTLDVSAMSLHRMVSAALKAEALNPGASIVALSYIGAQRVFSKYSDMADAKALLENIARNYGARLGQIGVRINTISQSPTPTTAGSGVEGFDSLYDFAEKVAPLGNASGEDCADLVVMLLSDFTRKITMQNIYSDGGFSSMGISDAILAKLYGDKNA